MEGDDVAYLEAARTVDDRAHSDAATAAFRSALVGGDRGTDRRHEGDHGGHDDHGDRGVRVLEAGAGTCGVLRRLVADGALPLGEWVAVDTDERALAAGRARLCEEAAEAGYAVDSTAVSEGGETAGGTGVRIGHRDRDAALRVRFRVDDARAVAEDGSEEPFDGVVARSFADLLAPEDVLALLRSAAPEGWYHLPLTFDGETRFAPDHPADDAVIDAFHGTMRNRGRAATLLVERLRAAGSPPAVDARADWVVAGDVAGEGASEEGDGYPADEATFLETVLDTVVASVRESGAVADATLSEWAETRRTQLERGTLEYEAVNRDLFGRVP
ncbi:class I SAM-dependent methyltransferase [Halobaculum sp. CBA1158]|uniref:class I SAM-dependent methyltransferase n=1 Tax=Halobaculum sp. CBA1158 TaxID=2904243 RepID=UPI001F4131D1|nr:class I SAM-dependent methyltransferase [Halobaculum sp. CBA1158]UIO99996.1 class I SAM-dependent methyltransferase [Halobaculum sp. CBA1158]